MKIFLIILTITLSYFYGVVYNKVYYELQIEGWYDMDKFVLGLFKSMFLLIAWLALLITYNASKNSILSYFLFTLPLLLEMVEDFLLLKNNIDKPITKKVFLVTMISILLITFGVAINFVALLDINILNIPVLLGYSFIGMFVGLMWVIGKVIWFVYDMYKVNYGSKE